MKIAADYYGKQLEIPNVFLFYLRSTLVDMREMFLSLLEIPATNENGEITYVRFDMFAPALDALFDLPLNDIEEFTRALYVSGIYKTNIKLCEEEEEVLEGDIAANKRIYPYRKFVKLKHFNYEEKKK